MKKFLDLMQPM